MSLKFVAWFAFFHSLYVFLDLNEKRPAQENEYPCSNSLSSSRIFNDYIGDDESKCSVLFQ